MMANLLAYQYLRDYDFPAIPTDFKQEPYRAYSPTSDSPFAPTEPRLPEYPQPLDLRHTHHFRPETAHELHVTLTNIYARLSGKF